MRLSCLMSSWSRASEACCIVSQSDWLPMMMPTTRPASLIRVPSRMQPRERAYIRGAAVRTSTPADQPRRARRASSDDVWQELALDLRDLILEQQLSLFEALQLELVEWSALGEPRDHLVEVAMLGLQGGELCFEGFYVEIHGRRPESSLIYIILRGHGGETFASAPNGDGRRTG